MVNTQEKIIIKHFNHRPNVENLNIAYLVLCFSFHYLIRIRFNLFNLLSLPKLFIFESDLKIRYIGKI